MTTTPQSPLTVAKADALRAAITALVVAWDRERDKLEQEQRDLRSTSPAHTYLAGRLAEQRRKTDQLRALLEQGR